MELNSQAVNEMEDIISVTVAPVLAESNNHVAPGKESCLRIHIEKPAPEEISILGMSSVISRHWRSSATVSVDTYHPSGWKCGSMGAERGDWGKPLLPCDTGAGGGSSSLHWAVGRAGIAMEHGTIQFFSSIVDLK